MGGFITAAVVVGGASMYAADQANDQADQRASDANASNQAASDRSRKLSAKNSAVRKSELLRRFDIKTGKVKDTQERIHMATATKLTNLDMQLAHAKSATTNTLATRKITGRLAERMQAAQAITGEMQKGTVVQSAEAQVQAIGDKLEAMSMTLESEQMNVDIDLSNAINSANNQEVRGYTFSQSTGGAGVMAAGVRGAASGASLGMSIGGYVNATGGK